MSKPILGLLLIGIVLAAVRCSTVSEAPPAAPIQPSLAQSAPPSPFLLDPTAPEVNLPVPERFKVLFETSEGDFVVEVISAWAPMGARRFYNLVSNGYYDGARFFRVLPGFVAQFGIHAVPEITAAWRQAAIPDDPPSRSNTRGTLTFATAGPNTRTVQLFVNLVDNTRLDPMGFSPFAVVTGGMDVVDRLHGDYGEGAPNGQGPDQARIQAEGESYLARDFPLLDSVLGARIIED
jgi:peptidyl-prolyl cis-trans isomerase A (cyclophilin A)